jgi:hypothetical protein
MSIAAPRDVPSALEEWRARYRNGPHAPSTLHEQATGRIFTWVPRPVWQDTAATQSNWLRLHLGPLLQMAAFLIGACILVALGTRGVTAWLMTLALIFTAIANSGPMLGAEFDLPVLGPLLLVFGWLATALSFPIIGLAVLHFPSRAPILDRYRWIPSLLLVLPAPVFVISTVSAAFLLGFDMALAPLTWFSQNGWLFDASFAAALAGNVLIVVEGINRYRAIADANERRRIQIVVYSGVPAVFAYALKAGVPLVSTLAGRPVEWPWVVEGVLQAIVLAPAFALPYAVAVKHVFSPRTVLRRSLQYALARRTLSMLIVLPVVALVASLVSERNRPLDDIVLGQPFFYAITVALLFLGLKYRDQAQRALDRRFFRAEYDAREILVALANRVPYESDPARLVTVVISEIDSALHPESVAVLAGSDAMFEVLSAARTSMRPLSRESGLVTLLQWSDDPLEIYLDDERSPVARLPAADRDWLRVSGVSLLVPILGGGSSEVAHGLIGVIALGPKRSEEPYTREDRKLLNGIATQMSVALDLSRLRRRSAGTPAAATSTPTLTPTMVVGGTRRTGSPQLAMCPTCHRCYDVDDLRAQHLTAVCPEDGAFLQPVVGMPPVVEGKYRVDAVVGRGGMGAVFRAHDLRLQRDVALKIVRADLMANAESQARFQREAQIVARLQHPAIVTIFDYGTVPEGGAFLVMEYVRGEDLRHLLKRRKKLDLAETIHLVTGIANGVDAAHRQGVLHRDLKPENILLPADGSGPKVLDFGVAKMADAGGPQTRQLTQAATIVGTPAYMAPEQLRGDALDARADVYSLGAVTFETLTGRLPFGTGNFIDLALRQSEGFDRVSFEGLSPALSEALKRALSLDRERRPATAAAFADELRSAL